MPNREPGIASQKDDPLIGTDLAGKYHILDILAKGGMGRIYRAEQRPLGRIVAVKVLSVKFEADEDPAFENRFFLEASTLAKLKHPNTVTVFDYGHADDTWYMVMELVDGRTLAQVLRDEGPLRPERALRIAYEIARSLTEAHQHGIIHRDLKPSNVMVLSGDEGEQIKVVDFGIVKVLEETGLDAITRPDRMVGSPRYMAPEQIKKGEIDGRTDLYALGVVLYEMLTQKPPFKGRTSIKTLMGHVQDPVPPMADKTDQPIPAPVEALVRRCLEKDQADRFPDVNAFKGAIRGVLAEVGVSLGDASGEYRPIAPSAPGPAPEGGDATTLAQVPPDLEAASWPRWAARGAVALVALLLLGSAVALYAAWRWDPTAAESPEAVQTVEPAPPAIDERAWRASELWVTSSPPRAEIWEGDRLWGTAPLTLPLRLGPEDPPRHFEARLPGHHPTSFAQGPTEGDVDQHLTLEPLAVPSTPAPAPPPAPPEPDIDIRVER